MPALTIVLDVEKDGFTAMRGVRSEVIHLGNDAHIEVGALAGGMASGAPSVAFCFELPDGRPVVAETSMALFLTAGEALAARYGDPRQPSALQQETEQVQAASQNAMDAQAAQGSTRQGVLEAGLRPALEHAIRDLPRDLAQLVDALGEDVDPGAFLLGGLMTTLVASGVNAVDAAKLAAPLLREYTAKAREACDGA